MQQPTDIPLSTLSSSLSSSLLLSISKKKESIEQETCPPQSKTMCQYKTAKCQINRSVKRNGTLHKLCPFHREKANRIQRKFDRSRRKEMTKLPVTAMSFKPLFQRSASSGSSLSGNSSTSFNPVMNFMKQEGVRMEPLESEITSSAFTQRQALPNDESSPSISFHRTQSLPVRQMAYSMPPLGTIGRFEDEEGGQFMFEDLWSTPLPTEYSVKQELELSGSKLPESESSLPELKIKKTNPVPFYQNGSDDSKRQKSYQRMSLDELDFLCSAIGKPTTFTC